MTGLITRTHAKQLPDLCNKHKSDTTYSSDLGYSS